MMGSFGTTKDDDGVIASTGSSKKSGCFARNDDTNDAPAGTPGGNGVFGLSTVPNASGVFGAHNNGGIGVAGNSDLGDGMQARTGSSKRSGIFARNDDTNEAPAGSPGGNGVFGLSTVPNASGVFGLNNNGGIGVAGKSEKGHGVNGHSNSNAGVFGESTGFDGGFFVSKSNGNAGVSGHHNPGHPLTRLDGTRIPPAKGYGVWGDADEGIAGVAGFSKTGRGVYGHSETDAGVMGQSKIKSGVVGTSENGQGLTAFSDNDIGIFSQGALFSGVFNGAFVVNKGPNPKDASKPQSDINGSIVINDGNLFVNKGDIILSGADCAEEFDILDVENVQSGTVMVINEEGALRVSDQPYDKKVAGVVSGAGDYKPGLVLDRQQSQNDRKPIALLGKVYCKVDAKYSAIQVGDLLTTSSTPGHAMKADNSLKAFGSVIGKALRPLQEGQGLIPILIALQ